MKMKMTYRNVSCHVHPSVLRFASTRYSSTNATREIQPTREKINSATFVVRMRHDGAFAMTYASADVDDDVNGLMPRL